MLEQLNKQALEEIEECLYLAKVIKGLGDDLLQRFKELLNVIDNEICPLLECKDRELFEHEISEYYEMFRKVHDIVYEYACLLHNDAERQRDSRGCNCMACMNMYWQMKNIEDWY